MAAVRLKDILVSCGPARAVAPLLCLPVSSSSAAVPVNKPCVPPALGPRPSEAPCTLPPAPANYRQPRSHSNSRNSYQNEQTYCMKLPWLQLSLNANQRTSLASLFPRDFHWFDSSNMQNKIISSANDNFHKLSINNTFLPQFTREIYPPSNDQQLSSPSLILVKKLYSMDDSHWLAASDNSQAFCSDAVILQQANRLEKVLETDKPQQEEQQAPQPEKQLQRQKQEKQLPSDKATPAQMSFILLKLREELPAFFDGHHSYHIYDTNMTFENHLSSNPWSSHGRRSYRTFLESSRLALKCSFSQTEVDLIKITKDVDQGKIEARWRIRGRPRYLLSLRERVLVEGFSTFLVNSSGLISLHKMDKVMPTTMRERERNPLLTWLGSLVGVATPKSPLPQPELVSSNHHF